MKNGRFDTSKYRGKLQKMGVLDTQSSKSPGPFPKLPEKRKRKKTTQFATLHRVRCRPTGDRWSPTARQPRVRGPRAGRRPAVAHQPRPGARTSACSNVFKFLLPFFFFRMRSTPAGWLQRMPTLPRVHLKTSNTHNF
jgi:hypothetical protein